MVHTCQGLYINKGRIMKWTTAGIDLEVSLGAALSSDPLSYHHLCVRDVSC